MKGKQLYLELSKRDYTESATDSYAQFLQTIHFHLALSGEIEKFYNFLETANCEKKLIHLKEIEDFRDEYFFKDLIIK